MPDAYTVSGYGRMVSDPVRVGAYARALEATVRPGSTVLDIGTGTGIFAMHAARLGARRVYAVEPADAIDTAAELARVNGVADRIEFIKGLTLEIELPEKVDVVVADLRGVLPPFRRTIATLADARARLLKPGGHLIPLRDTLFTAPIEAAETWAANAGPEAVLGFDYAAARRYSFSRWTRGIFQSSQLLSAPRAWAEIDYLTRTPPDADVCGTADCVVTRPGTAHGLAVWFVAELAEGVCFDTGPDHTTVYQTALFPWPEPQALAEGDVVRGTLEARLVGEEYLWSWHTVIERAGRLPVSWRQTDFSSQVLPMRELRKRADSFVPRLGGDGEVDAFALARMDGRASIGEIARALMERFPGRFARWEDAVSRVGGLSEQYAA